MTTGTLERTEPERRRRWRLAVLVLVLLAAAVVIAVLAWLAVATKELASIERVGLPSEDVRARLGGPEAGAPDNPLEEGDDGLDDARAVLIIGSDARAGLGGARADVIMLGLLPGGGKDPALVSLPRDLWVPNPCSGSESRINAGLNGCGERATGPELLTVMVEDFTGFAVDNYVKLDFDGFSELIDTVGGVRVCVDHRTRERGLFELPAGCSRLDGETALAWVRSRRTEERVDGTWRTVPGVDDLERNRRQQEVVLQLFSRMGSGQSLRNLTELSENLATTATVDDGFHVTTTARLAWRLRGVDRDDIVRIEIPVERHTTADGAAVLLPTEPFAETLAREYPGFSG